MQASLDEFTGNMINEGHNLKLQIFQHAPVRCLTNAIFFFKLWRHSSAGCCYGKSILNLNSALPSPQLKTPLSSGVSPMAVEGGL